MSNPPYDPNLTEWLQLAGNEIARKTHRSEQVAWVMFLLSEVASQLPASQVTALLKDVREAVDLRLQQP